MTPPSKDLAEMVVLTDVELHQVPYHPDYADPSSFMYKSMESTLISTVISKIILLRELFIKKTHIGLTLYSQSSEIVEFAKVASALVSLQSIG